MTDSSVAKEYFLTYFLNACLMPGPAVFFITTIIRNSYHTLVSQSLTCQY